MKNKKKRRLLPSLCCAFLLFVAPLGLSACEKDNLPNVTITQTSVVPTYDFSALPIYKDFTDVAEVKYLVPGLNEGLVPQGMDVWEEKELLFITGYFYGDTNTSGSPSSMIVVVDLKTGEFAGKYCIKKEDGTYYTDHNGGIAVTEKNIFIECGGCLARIPLSQIEELGKTGTLQIVETIKVPVGTQFINYSNGVLWTGDWQDPTIDPTTPEWQHMTNNDGTTYCAGAVGYVLKDTESEFSKENWDPTTMSYATPDYYFSITTKVQGFTFVGDKIVLSASQGYDDSNILVYENVLNNTPDTSVSLNGKSVPVWFLDSGVQAKAYNALPMSEGVTSYNGKLLILFESASKRWKPFIRTDRVWSMTMSTKED